MPRVCTSQPAKAELQVPGSAAAGSTTAGIRGQQLNPAGYGASWAPAKVSPRAQLWARANPRHPWLPASCPGLCGEHNRQSLWQSPALSTLQGHSLVPWWPPSYSLEVGAAVPLTESSTRLYLAAQSSPPSAWTTWLTDPRWTPPWGRARHC